MDAIVVYESMYGNTRAVAEAIAEGLGGAPVLAVGDAAPSQCAAMLTVVGGPTHVHGVASGASRRMAVASAAKSGAATISPEAGEGAGLRGWLGELPRRAGAYAAAFDTRLEGSAILTGAASHGIARRLRRRGYKVLGSESFRVTDAEGPLVDGEIERARSWGEGLASELAARRSALAVTD